MLLALQLAVGCLIYFSIWIIRGKKAANIVLSKAVLFLLGKKPVREKIVALSFVIMFAVKIYSSTPK